MRASINSEDRPYDGPRNRDYEEAQNVSMFYIPPPSPGHQPHVDSRTAASVQTDENKESEAASMESDSLRRGA